MRSDIRQPDTAKRLDFPHLTLVPGFIEPHVHGAGGFDVMHATWETMTVISRKLASHGTTSFLPTTVSAPSDVLTETVERISGLIGMEFEGATPLGIHLEGPFINMDKRGTHRQASLHKPDAALLSKWIQRTKGRVKLITLAPELQGAMEVAGLAERSRVVVGMGHSDASFVQATEAADSGIRYAVHTFNAMRQLSILKNRVTLAPDAAAVQFVEAKATMLTAGAAKGCALMRRIKRENLGAGWREQFNEGLQTCEGN